MHNFYSPSVVGGLPAVVLGVDLTIARHENLHRTLQTASGANSRAIRLRIDPSLDMIYLCEMTLPGTLPCLQALTKPGVAAVTLRAVRLGWQPEPGHAIGRGTPTLAALESGTCFLTANRRKIAVASFAARMVHAARIEMEVQGRPNLLDYLRADSFTLEISGTNRRRLVRPLAFSAVLEFDVQLSRPARA